MATTKEIQNKLEAYQNGMPQGVDMPQISHEGLSSPGFDPELARYEFNKARNQRRADMMMNGRDYYASTIPDNDLTEELVKSGYGTTKFDEKTNPYQFIEDQEDARARVQSGLGQFINGGVVKFATTTLGQIVDVTAGTVLGLGNVAYDFAKSKINDEDYDALDAFNSFVVNPVSEGIYKANEFMESVAPNFKTAEYRENEQNGWDWLKNISTANFIGDTFLKNLGFTVGSQVGTMAWLSALRPALARTISGDLAKAAIAASNKSEKAVQAINNAAKKGNLAGKEFREITNASKELWKLNGLTQTMGAVASSMSESRTEAIGAAEEFVQDMKRKSSDEYEDKLKGINDQIYDEFGPAAFQYYYDDAGNIVDLDIVAPSALRRKAQLEKQYSDEYDKKMGIVEREAEHIAMAGFLMNMGVLTTSNLVQFGRMYSGGWKNANLVKAGVKGGVEMSDDAVKAAYKGSTLTGKTAKAYDIGASFVKGGLSEGFEELSQKVISEGEKRIAEQDVALFNNDAFNEDAIDRIGRRMSTMFDSAKTVVSDPSSWEEFFVGALTGLIGMPGKGRWNGGAPAEYKERRERRELSDAAAEELNKRVNSKEFQDRWKHYVRNNKYEISKEEALKNKDRYAWHTEDSKQLINDIILFGKSGRIQDLMDITDHFANLSEGEAEEVRQMMKSSAESYNRLANITDADIVNPVKERAAQVRQTINDYNEMYEAILVRNPEASEKRIEEMLFTSLQLKNFENRYSTLVNELMKGKNSGDTGLDDRINAITSVAVKKDGKVVMNTNKEAVEKAKQKLRDAIDDLVALQTPDRDVYDMLAKDIQIQSEIDYIKQSLNLSDEEKSRLDDVRKLADSRRDFFKKLMTLESMTDEKFEEKADSQEKMKERQAVAAANNAADTFNSVFDVRDFVNSQLKSRSEADVRKDLAKVGNNRFVGDYLKIDKFNNGVRDIINSIEPTKYPGTKKMAMSILDNKIESSASYGMFTEPTFPAYEKTVPPGQVMTALEKETYDKAVQMITEAYETLKNSDSRTGANKSSAKTAVPAPKAPANAVVQSSGTDPAAAAAPVVPVPSASRQAPRQIGSSDMSHAPNLFSLGPVNETVDEAFEKQNEIAENDRMDAARVEGDLEKRTTEGEAVRYLEPAIPEMDTNQVREYRENGYSGVADLRDFDEVNPSYSEIYTALKNAGAFSYVDRGNLQYDDRIYFAIDPSFPTWTDPETGDVHPQILLQTRRNDGKMQIVGILPSGMKRTEYRKQYEGLDVLREDIMNDYEKFMSKEENAGKVFYFGFDENGKFDQDKSSTVFSVRRGFHHYNYSFNASGERNLAEDNKPIVDIEGYNKSDPIVIFRAGEPRTIRGSVDGDVNYRNSGIYYIVKDALGGNVPVRLNFAHYNEAEIEGTELRTRIMDAINSFLSGTITQGKCNELKNAIRKYLFFDDLSITLDKDNDGSNVIRFSSLQRDENGDYVTGEDGNGIWVNNKIFDKDYVEGLDDRSVIANTIESILLSYNLPVNVNPNTSASDLDEFIKMGLIKCNVDSFDMRGANFYFNAYNPSTHKFDKEFGKVYEEQEEEQSVPVVSQTPEAAAASYGAKLIEGRKFINGMLADDNGAISFGQYNGKDLMLPVGSIEYVDNLGYKGIMDSIDDLRQHGFNSPEDIIRDVFGKHTKLERISSAGTLRMSYKNNGNVFFIDFQETDDKCRIINAGVDNEAFAETGDVIYDNSAKESPEVPVESEKPAEAPSGVTRTRRSHIRHLTVEQAGRFTGYVDFDKEMAWLNKALPQLSEEARVDIVNGLIEVSRGGSKAYGQFASGIMTISSEAIEGTTYHEAFHYVFNTLLSEKDKSDLLADAAGVYGTGETIVLEEKIAEEFRHWKLFGTFTDESGLNGKKSGFIDRLVSFFKRLLHISDNSGIVMKRMFSAVDSGRYARKAESASIPSMKGVASAFTGEFKKEHIEQAIKTLESEAANGIMYNIVGNTRNIRYSPKTGFEFRGPIKTKANASKAMVNSFRMMLARNAAGFEYLDDETRTNLEQKGITKEDFDSSNKDVREQILRCSSVF